eukprot:356500-Chlamydomonas_euryale.AAC.4
MALRSVRTCLQRTPLSKASRFGHRLPASPACPYCPRGAAQLSGRKGRRRGDSARGRHLGESAALSSLPIGFPFRRPRRLHAPSATDTRHTAGAGMKHFLWRPGAHQLQPGGTAGCTSHVLWHPPQYCAISPPHAAIPTPR